MILDTGNRTDIPAFYTEWLMNRFREGYALSRNPYNPGSVTRYLLDPKVVDGVVFCTKNPAPTAAATATPTTTGKPSSRAGNAMTLPRPFSLGTFSPRTR